MSKLFVFSQHAELLLRAILFCCVTTSAYRVSETSRHARDPKTLFERKLATERAPHGCLFAPWFVNDSRYPGGFSLTTQNSGRMPDQ